MPTRFSLFRCCGLLLITALLISSVVLPAAAAPSAQPGCYDLVQDGGFEQHTAWVLGGGPTPPAYVYSPVAAGSWAMQIGNVNQLPATPSYSTLSQTLAIPGNALSAELSFSVWTYHEANPGNDRQTVALLTPGATAHTPAAEPVWSELSNSGDFQLVRRSLNQAIGSTVDLTFSVFNDGSGGRTWMVVDAVSLTVCLPAITPTFTPGPAPTSPLPSPTPTVTAAAGATVTPTATFLPVITATPTATFLPVITATPTAISPAATATAVALTPPAPGVGCVNLLANSSFEWDGDWTLGQTKMCPVYAGAPSPVLQGNRSMALGSVALADPGRVGQLTSYSSIQQTVTLPADAQTASLRFSYFASSNAAINGYNRQEVVLLDPSNYNATIDVIWRVTENNTGWQTKTIDLTRYLTRYAGRPLTVYFNARNEAGHFSAMYLDDVQLQACNPAWAMAPTATFATLAPAAAGTHLPIQVLAGATIVTVDGTPTPLGLATPVATVPLTTVTPTAGPRRDQGALFSLDRLRTVLDDSPLIMVGCISVLVLAGMVLALLFFRSKQ